MEITIEVPEALGKELAQFKDRLLEVMELGLQALLLERQTGGWDETSIMELLVSRPTPAQVLALKPSPELQARVSELLQRSKQGQLSAAEAAELERHLTLEHLVRLAKAHAYKRLSSPA